MQTLAATIGNRLRLIRDGQHVPPGKDRDSRKVSGPALADRLGRDHPMSQATLSRTEAGKRDVTVREWLALATALRVAPGSLLVDLSDDEEVEVGPGHVMHPMALWAWVSGLGADTLTTSYPFDARLRAWQRRYWAWREFDELVGWQAGTSGREKAYRDDPPKWFDDAPTRPWNGPPPVGTNWNNAKGEARWEGYGSARRLVSACFEARVQRLPALPMARGRFDTLAWFMGWDDEWKNDPEGWAVDLGIEVIEDPPEEKGATP